ncbi:MULTISPECIES: hypothetical protein [Streptomyces]|uniref:hypothetical protein n=1 Tax=Streptomyces TaxID=1883 RepID=UPI0007733BC9|nr:MULTISPECIES: hypothetical protein [Streptomyces]AVV45341.1 hypothetical protein C6376_32260 [Streptomyces sp. P3]MBP5896518.1 hypothetical protein [Streptomyces sp. LBUM 1481]MDX2680212.1 hypothetical protein [Streptomyces sp. NY05-11A]MDX3115112.1 hypothetical protein [Streptomyces scabiei]MDX3243534.1 hypothetical protein [Streptomyces sp. ME18-1-4]
MDDSTPGERTPADGEPAPSDEKSKSWYAKHKPKIRVMGGVTLSVSLAVVAYLARQGSTRHEVEDIADYEPASDDEATEQPRQSSPAPDRDPFLRRLPPGQHASEEAKARYRELTGNELPDGYTVVRRWMYGTAA